MARDSSTVDSVVPIEARPLSHSSSDSDSDSDSVSAIIARSRANSLRMLAELEQVALQSLRAVNNVYYRAQALLMRLLGIPSSYNLFYEPDQSHRLRFQKLDNEWAKLAEFWMMFYILALYLNQRCILAKPPGVDDVGWFSRAPSSVPNLAAISWRRVLGCVVEILVNVVYVTIISFGRTLRLEDEVRL